MSKFVKILKRSRAQVLLTKKKQGKTTNDFFSFKKLTNKLNMDKLNNFIESLSYTQSKSTVLKSLCNENIEECKTILESREENSKNYSLSLNNDSLPIDRFEFEDKWCQYLAEKQNQINYHKLQFNEINTNNIAEYASKLSLNEECNYFN